jgi:hypothetical protein
MTPLWNDSRGVLTVRRVTWPSGSPRTLTCWYSMSVQDDGAGHHSLESVQVRQSSQSSRGSGSLNRIVELVRILSTAPRASALALRGVPEAAEHAPSMSIWSVLSPSSTKDRLSLTKWSLGYVTTASAGEAFTTRSSIVTIGRYKPIFLSRTTGSRSERQPQESAAVARRAYRPSRRRR